MVTVICPPDSPHEHMLERARYEVLPLDLAGAALSAAWRLRHALEERVADVVFVRTAPEQLIASAAARLAGRPAILRRLSAGEPPSSAPAVALRLAATGFLYTSDDALRAAPPGSRATIPPLVVPLGVTMSHYDVARSTPAAVLDICAAGNRLIACLHAPGGRLHAIAALRVMAQLAPRHPELRLALLGPESAAEELRMHAAALHLTRTVAFLGERDDAVEVYRAATLGWVAAEGDEAAYGCLDLTALRVPVLAARSAVAATYVADGITGLLFDSLDPSKLAAAVTRLLARAEERQAMGEAGRTRVAREFTEEAMVAGFERAALAAQERCA